MIDILDHDYHIRKFSYPYAYDNVDNDSFLKDGIPRRHCPTLLSPFSVYFMVKLSSLAFVAGLLLCEHIPGSLGLEDAQVPLGERPDPTWHEKYGGQLDQPFSGPLSFSHLPYALCLQDEAAMFDIAILGMPFDTSVSYRPGCGFSSYRFSRSFKYHLPPERDLALMPFVPEVEGSVQQTVIPCFGEATHTKLALTCSIAEM